MLDIALIRAQPDDVKQRLATLNDPDAGARIDRILEQDARRRELLNASESLQARRNRLNRALGPLRGNRQLDAAVKSARMQEAARLVAQQCYDEALALLQPDTDVSLPAAVAGDLKDAMQSLVTALRGMSERHSAWQAEIREVEDDLREQMLWLPNLPHASVPVAASEDDNRPWLPEGDFREFDVAPLPHWELAPALGILDLERGVKIAGSRGYVLRGDGARLQQALINFFLDQARAEWLRAGLRPPDGAGADAGRLGAAAEVRRHGLSGR